MKDKILGKFTTTQDLMAVERKNNIAKAEKKIKTKAKKKSTIKTELNTKTNAKTKLSFARVNGSLYPSTDSPLM